MALPSLERNGLRFAGAVKWPCAAILLRLHLSLGVAAVSGMEHVEFPHGHGPLRRPLRLVALESVAPQAPGRVQAVVEVLELSGSQWRAGLVVEVDLDFDQHALRELAQTADRFEAGRCSGDRASVDAGRRQPSDDPRLRDRLLERCAYEIRFPAGQLDQPLERNTGLSRPPERERDGAYGAADNLDGHVLAGLRAPRLRHRADGFTVTLGHGFQLPLGLSPETLRRRCGGHRSDLVIVSPRRA